MNDRLGKDRERSDRVMIVLATFKPRVRTIGSGWVQASYCPTMYITMYMTYEHKIITLNTQ